MTTNGSPTGTPAGSTTRSLTFDGAALLSTTRAETFAKEASAVIEQYMAVDEQVAKIRAALAVAERAGQREQASQFAHALVQAGRHRDDAALAVLTEKVGARDLDGAKAFMEELLVKIEMAGRVRNNYVRVRAQHELRVAVGEFGSAEASAASERAASEQGIETARAQAVAAVRVVDAMIAGLLDRAVIIGSNAPVQGSGIQLIK